MGWDHTLHFGMYRGHYVKSVFENRPSYLVWLCVNTSHKFSEDVMARVHEYVSKGIQKGLRHDMIALFRGKCKEGCPW